MRRPSPSCSPPPTPRSLSDEPHQHIAAGAVLGLFNGLLVAFGKVPALVITLGTLYAYRGINVLWTGSNRINSSDMPKSFLDVGTETFLFIPYLTIIALVV